MKVSDLVNAAGGIEKNAYLETAEITRRRITQTGMETAKIDISLKKALADVPGHNVTLQDYDHLIVRPIPELEFDRVAEISGEVRFPGVYPIRKGETLSSLIERAGGYTDRAYLRGAVFSRESAKAIQRKRMDDLVSKLEETILIQTNEAISGALDDEARQSQELALEAKKELLKKLRQAKLSGRVIVRLTGRDQFKGSKYDIELEKDDKLVVPERPGVVNIIGEVFNPSAMLYEDGKNVKYYLRRVGGLTKEADKKQISIVKVDGSVISSAQKNPGKVAWDDQSHQWLFGGFMGLALEPGDTIIAPKKLDKFYWLKTTKDLTEIIFHMALSAGVVLAL
jgi:protein involved in polysaccharide export with SLBB domain